MDDLAALLSLAFTHREWYDFLLGDVRTLYVLSLVRQFRASFRVRPRKSWRYWGVDNALDSPLPPPPASPWSRSMCDAYRIAFEIVRLGRPECIPLRRVPPRPLPSRLDFFPHDFSLSDFTGGPESSSPPSPTSVSSTTHSTRVHTWRVPLASCNLHVPHPQVGLLWLTDVDDEWLREDEYKAYTRFHGQENVPPLEEYYRPTPFLEVTYVTLDEKLTRFRFKFPFDLNRRSYCIYSHPRMCPPFFFFFFFFYN